VGALLDRLFAPRIAIAICVIAAAGIVMFIANGISSASLTALALGMAMGAELDLMGYLVARYFGLAEFGRIYGWLYAAFIFGSGLGPLWIGAIRDTSGSYDLALVISAIGLMVACGAFLLLPRYQARTTEGGGGAVVRNQAASDFAARPGG
jgi:MFS family permease